MTLVVTGVLKLFDGTDGRLAHHHGQILSLMSSPAVLFLAGVLEVVLGIALMTRFWKISLYIVTALLICFWSVTILAIVSGADPQSCGCIGPVTLDYPSHLALIAGMYALTLTMFLRIGREPQN